MHSLSSLSLSLCSICSSRLVVHAPARPWPGQRRGHRQGATSRCSAGRPHCSATVLPAATAQACRRSSGQREREKRKARWQGEKGKKGKRKRIKEKGKKENESVRDVWHLQSCRAQGSCRKCTPWLRQGIAYNRKNGRDMQTKQQKEKWGPAGEGKDIQWNNEENNRNGDAGSKSMEQSPCQKDYYPARHTRSRTSRTSR